MATTLRRPVRTPVKQVIAVKARKPGITTAHKLAQKAALPKPGVTRKPATTKPSKPAARPAVKKTAPTKPAVEAKPKVTRTTRAKKPAKPVEPPLVRSMRPSWVPQMVESREMTMNLPFGSQEIFATVERYKGSATPLVHLRMMPEMWLTPLQLDMYREWLSKIAHKFSSCKVATIEGTKIVWIHVSKTASRDYVLSYKGDCFTSQKAASEALRLLPRRGADKVLYKLLVKDGVAQKCRRMEEE